MLSEDDCYDSEEDIHLSAGTFAALQEFYKEQETRDKKLNNIKCGAAAASTTNTEPDEENIEFEENWQLSQFWYDDNTVKQLTNIVRRCHDKSCKVALVSCPTLYKKIKENFDNVKLFEYDERFAAYGSDFVFYDYKSPLNIPRELASTFDIVIADPPFLSDECLTKTAVTIKYLTNHKIILCTGSTMACLAERLLNVKKAKFEPHHRNNLANEFWCYSNFDMDKFYDCSK